VPDRIRADSGRQISESRQPSRRLILVELIQPEALRAEGPLGMGAPRWMGPPARLSAGATPTAAAAAATATFALTALTGAVATTAAGAAGGGGSTGAAKGGGTGTGGKGHRQLLG